MDLDKHFINQSFQELEELENETKKLLESIRGKPTDKKSASKKIDPKYQTIDTLKGTKAAKQKKKKKLLSKSQSLTTTARPQGLSSDLLFSNTHEGRVTVEVLDDASPDATPREAEADVHLRRIENDKQKLQALRVSEQHFRKLQFDDERTRITIGADTFIPGPGRSVADVDKERLRLAKIEDTARVRLMQEQAELCAHRDFLETDKAALQVQRAFRGHIGRQKFALTAQIKKMHDDDQYGDWIEVNDPNTGDIWYYNKESGLSQWNKPAAMNRRRRKTDAGSTAAGFEVQQKGGRLPSLAGGNSSSGAGAGGRGKQLSVSMALPSIDALAIARQHDQRPHSTGSARGMNSSRVSSAASSPKKLKKTLSFKPDAALEAAAAAAPAGVGAFEEEKTQREVNHILGIDRITAQQALTAPDGSFKPQLRTVVLDALLDTRFDSVATVLADQRWYEGDQEHFASAAEKRRMRSGVDADEAGGSDGVKQKKRTGYAGDEDYSRAPLVAELTFNKKKSKRGRSMKATDGDDDNNNNRLTDSSGNPLLRRMQSLKGPQDLTFRDVDHTGFETSGANEIMCFGCWSAGLQRKCELHHGDAPVKPSQTMLLCRNWDLDVMRRRYRAEEIQEIFLQREASLRYDVKHKKFSTVVEQRHPIYRFVSERIACFVGRMVLFEKIKRWLLSLAEEFRIGRVSSKTAEMAMLMRIKRNAVNFSKLSRFSHMNHAMLPKAPFTGSSWPERAKKIQFLHRQWDQSVSDDVDLILVYPTPVPRFLYQPREYHLGVPKTIPMPKPSYDEDDPFARVQPGNTHIRDDSRVAWMEKMSAAVARDAVQAALSQVKAFTPLTEAGIISRTVKPVPSTIKAATIARKPCPQNLAVGGLALELLVYQLVSTYIPTQYGNFMVTDKSSVSPGISPEENITFQSLTMAPIVQQHIIRPLEHPLNYRRAPTITLNCNIDPDADRHFYGANRPEQTGEQESHGFRTTSWAPMLLTYVETDPQTFVPGQEVVSLNDPKANVAFTTHADHTYPFCEPSTRDNSTLDFYHLLLAGVVSAAKAQIFTALTVQEPGTFMNGYDMRNPMGHLLVNVYRSWAFTQKDTIQEFKTDDGVSYWYHRKTGQTFWERPLFEDEEQSPLQGGIRLDVQHAEEPSELAKSAEGATRRYTQGEFRQQMMNHIETKKDALIRRKAAAATVKNARERGVVPMLEGVESVVNNAQTSTELGSRLDFPQQTNSSLLGGYPTESAVEPTVGGQLVQYGEAVDVHSAQERSGANLDHLHPYNVQHNQLTAGGMLQPQQQLHLQQGGGGGGIYAPQGFADISMDGASRPATGAAAAAPADALRRGSVLDEPSLALQEASGTAAAAAGPAASGSMVQSSRGGQAANPFLGQGSGFPGLNMDAMNNLSNMLNSMMNTMMLMDSNNPQAMLTMGMSMGMALMHSNGVNDMVTDQVMRMNPPQQAMGSATAAQAQAQAQHQQMGGGDGAFPTIPEESETTLLQQEQSASGDAGSVRSASGFSQQQAPSRVSSAHSVSMLDNKNEPIGLPRPTIILSADKDLDHSEELNQKLAVVQRVQQPLNTMEQARKLKVNAKPSETPDMLPPKSLTDPKPSNAELGMIESGAAPLLAYPELSTRSGTHIPYVHRPPAGEGTSFVSLEQELAQQLVPGTENLRRTVMPLPVGFFEAIEAKHVAKQAADYLPQVPNLPQARNIGRVKPRSAALDWLMISFDPWSAGKNPLSTEYVASMMEKAEKFVEGGQARAQDAFEQMRQSTLAGAYVKTEDTEGLAQQRAEVTRAEHLAQDFKLICSLCRHGKFGDAEQMMNQPDWSVPIDYQDDQGNTLLHIVVQNGNKRMVKLCLRRGAALDIQNLTGQTPLHFAYGYGYADVGDYLLAKGANDSIRNKDGLTCYEGLGAKELELL